MIPPQHPQHLLTGRLPLGQRRRHIDNVVDDPRVKIVVLGRHVPDHGRVGHVDLIAVQPVVTAVLVLGRHQAHDAKWQAIQEDLRSWRGRPIAKQLLADIVSQYGYTQRIGFVGLYQKAALRDRYGADLGIQRLDTVDRERSAVISAGYLRAIL